MCNEISINIETNFSIASMFEHIELKRHMIAYAKTRSFNPDTDMKAKNIANTHININANTFINTNTNRNNDILTFLLLLLILTLRLILHYYV